MEAWQTSANSVLQLLLLLLCMPSFNLNRAAMLYSCLQLSPPTDLLRRTNSSGLLLECGEQGGSLQHASSSGSARLLPGASSVDVLEQAASGALGARQHPAGGLPAKGDPPVTAVGPSGAAGSGAEAGLPTRPLGSSVDLLSPFGDVTDHEGERPVSVVHSGGCVFEAEPAWALALALALGKGFALQL